MQMKDLKPTNVWAIFDEITKVPRPSGRLSHIRQWLIDFADKHGFTYRVDEVGNVAIMRPADPGFENVKKIVLQGHQDMVAEKLPTSNHNFDTDPIETIVDGEWVRANGTTLGADDGMGLALGLAALIDPDLKCGALELLATVDEETGLTGAINIKADMLQGDYLLNLDSEDDGIITMSCAGGLESLVYFDYTPSPAPADRLWFKLTLSGLHGGHSGSDIDKGFASGTKQIARLLWRLEQKLDLTLASVNAGNLHNAIAHHAEAVVGIKAADKEQLAVLVNEFAADVKAEYVHTEPKVEVTCASTDVPATVIDADTAARIISVAFVAPHGIASMSKEVEGLVETSTNFASVKTLEDKKTIYMEFFSRGAVESRKYELAHQIEALMKLAGARKVEEAGGYQGWAPNANNHILKVAVAEWEKLYGVKPIVNAIHAGLECGLFSKVRPDMDMISYGPTLENVHSPQERCHIPAVQKAWDFTVAIIKAVAAGA